MVISCRLAQLKNAFAPMLCTPSGITARSKYHILLKARSGITSFQPNSILYSPPAGPADFSWGQSRNAPHPINSTLSGITTLLNPEQPINASAGILAIPSANVTEFKFANAKASSPMLSTLAGMVICSKPQQLENALRSIVFNLPEN